jgi:hypoxanthine phosphoribosyltransferase
MVGSLDEGIGFDLEELTWEGFGKATQDLARMIVDDGYRPDIVLAIARGGLFTAGALGYALGVKLLHVVNVEFYTGVDQRLNMPVMLPPIPDPSQFSGARILIADDVADTGATIRLTQSFCERHVAEVRSAVIYEKPRSTVKCDYVWNRTSDWIHFPWDRPIAASGAQIRAD